MFLDKKVNQVFFFEDHCTVDTLSAKPILCLSVWNAECDVELRLTSLFKVCLSENNEELTYLWPSL